MIIAYITAKRNYFGKRFIEVSSVLMFAVPGTVLGISYVLGFNSIDVFGHKNLLLPARP